MTEPTIDDVRAKLDELGPDVREAAEVAADELLASVRPAMRHLPAQVAEPALAGFRMACLGCLLHGATIRILERERRACLAVMRREAGNLPRDLRRAVIRAVDRLDRDTRFPMGG